LDNNNEELRVSTPRCWFQSGEGMTEKGRRHWPAARGRRKGCCTRHV